MLTRHIGRNLYPLWRVVGNRGFDSVGLEQSNTKGAWQAIHGKVKMCRQVTGALRLVSFQIIEKLAEDLTSWLQV